MCKEKGIHRSVLRIVWTRAVGVHIDVALKARVGADARDIVLELGWECQALSDVEAEIGTISREARVGADKDVAAVLRCVCRTGLNNL